MNLKNIGIGILILIGLTLVSIIMGALVSVSAEDVVGEAIGVIHLNGIITYEASAGLLGGTSDIDDVITQLDKARKAGNIRGVLLIINSPGGAPVASHELVRAIERVKVQKPVVAWIADVGASGAYWAASACNRTVADELSVTGSVGVISQHMDYGGLYDKLGINTTIIKGGRLKDAGASHRPLTDEELELIQGIVNTTHKVFIQDVVRNRGLTVEQVLEVSTGRLFIGIQAKDIGLVDELGGKDDALRVVTDLAGIQWRPRTVELKTKKGFLDLMDGLTATLGYGIGRGMVASAEQTATQQVLSVA
ncbi:MAG: signal peptide peptidase SppA [Candidatus Undinarchaeales archaeon]|jgi:protease-4|nr:signal peptide peptidase SppA [Candidatus Undinarchaeales archaeon]MDP7493850.1 signal peptide peptidase SppA [Candidatus Undinarchaeales archaeon]